MTELKIHDIKPLVEISDYSLFLFILLCTLGALVVIAFIYLIYKLIKNRGKNQRKVTFNKLKEVDLKNSKKAAYEITKYARELSISEREKNLCEELIRELEKYKYKKEVKEFDKESLVKYEMFCEGVDV